MALRPYVMWKSVKQAVEQERSPGSVRLTVPHIHAVKYITLLGSERNPAHLQREAFW